MKAFSMILWMMDKLGNLKSKRIKISMYFVFLSESLSFEEESSKAQLNTSKSLEWYKVSAVAFYSIEAMVGNSSRIIFMNGCNSRRYWLRLFNSWSILSSVLNDDRQ